MDTHNTKTRREAKKIFLILWCIGSFCLLFLIPIGYFCPDILLNVSNLLQVKHTSCFFCGMTRGFIHLIYGNISLAQLYNKNVLDFMIVLLLNEVAFGIYLITRLRKFIK